jgi:CDP-diacylglycerol--serine O-phosphatidyltransferase
MERRRLQRPNGRPFGKSIFLLPNLLTTGSLFAGFYSIVQAMNGRYEAAAVAIFVAMVLDGLDGRVARMTHTQSAFGAEYDSLSDMVSFGAAPALVMYVWALKPMGKLGWVAAFIYCAGAALRLARFNTQIATTDKRFFVGLPSPAAAAMVVGFLWLVDDYFELTGADVHWLAWCVTLAAGVLMVSNLRYYSFKVVHLRFNVPFMVLPIAVLGLLLVSYYPPMVLFALFSLYVLSGFLTPWILRRWPANRPPDRN